MYTPSQYQRARELLDGEPELSDREIARRSGVNRTTIRNWRLGMRPMHQRYSRSAFPLLLTRPLHERSYAYLFGLYLGDGSIAVTKRGFVFVRFSLDRKYPGIGKECAAAVASVAGKRPSLYDREHQGVLIVQASGRTWLNLFPQHGPGKKHERKIELEGWQREITHRYTREFIRGLIHSDGSRCINRFSVNLRSGKIGRYEYPRYSSPTTRRTFAGSSATTATCSPSARRSRMPGTSRFRTATVSRSWTRSSGRSAKSGSLEANL